jgi:hypothetical protein
MEIIEKVEEIRKKPEHIRMRYVWFFVAVSMVFVIALWIISLNVSQKESQFVPTDSNLFNSNIIDQFGEQKKVFDETQKEVKDSLSNLEKAAPSSPQSAGQDNQNQADLKNGTGQ